MNFKRYSYIIIFCMMIFIIGCETTNESGRHYSVADHKAKYIIFENQFFQMIHPDDWIIEYEFNPNLIEYKMYLVSSLDQKIYLRIMLSPHESSSEMLIDSQRKLKEISEDSAQNEAKRLGLQSIEVKKVGGEFSEGYIYRSPADEKNEVALHGGIQVKNVFVSFLAVTHADSKSALEVALEMILSIKFEKPVILTIKNN